MINATQDSEQKSENKQNSAEKPDKPVEIKTLGDISHADSKKLSEHKSGKQTTTAPKPVSNNTSSSAPPQNSNKSKRKFNFKTLVGVAVLALIIIGSGAGFYLTQYTQQDIRQQAYLGQSCSVDTNCSGWPNEVCDGGTCVAANQNPTCPAFEAWGNCDPTPGTDENECTGSHYTANECTLGYIEWRCGNKQWIPDYGNPNNDQCAGDCPWPLTNGVCCPTGGDACNPSTDNYKCIADPFVSHCEDWNNASCPASQQGYWKAIDWCVGDGCECGPGGLFEDYEGPGCDCNGPGISCNDRCDTTAECQEKNSNWSCVTADDGLKRCRLTSNPSNSSCQPGGGGSYQCNSDCSTTAQCQGDLGSSYSCVNSKCRLTANPSSSTCQPQQTTYQCNSDCSTTAQCQGDLGNAYSCVNNKCRLTANPSSSTCEPASQERNFNISTEFICPDGSTPSEVQRRLAWRIWPPTGTVWNYNPKLDFGGVTTNISQTINIPDITEVSNQSMYIALVEGSLFHTWWTDGDDDLEPYQPIQDPNYPAIEAGDFFEEPMFRIKVADPSVPENITLQFQAPEELCLGDAPMCKDVAILDQENNELIPTATPNPFYIGQIIKFRCAADDLSSPLIEKFEFKLTEPDGTIVQGADINPTGKSAISQNYQITENGTFSAQCRICQTDGTCQPYVNIGGGN